jgi:hypothetical protein
MIATLLLAVSMTPGETARRLPADISVLGDDDVNLALGAKAGLRIGPLELYGGVDPFEAAVATEDQLAAQTLPLAAGVRAYLPVPGPLKLFGALDATPWNDPAHDGDTQLRRRAVAAVGVRSQRKPLFYDVTVGPGFWARHWPGCGSNSDAHLAVTVQGALGLSF